MAKDKYPLKQILEIKKKRVEDAEVVVRLKQEALNAEKEKLAAQEAARDKVKTHRIAKIQQLRDELDHGTTSPKIQQMKAYLKVVDEKLKVEEKKVKDQQVKVDAAAKELEDARHQLFLKRQEVDKLETHRDDWNKEQRKEAEIAEGREQDEIGNVIYGMHRKDKL